MKTKMFLALLACAAAPPMQGQAPTGYYLGDSVFLPDSTREVLAGGRFQITIQRVTADSFESKLLAMAERLFPDSATINRVAALESLPPVVARLNAAAALPGNRWWWDNFDDAWTPYAITGATVHYYRQRVYDRAATRSLFPSSATTPQHKGSFSYRAVVERLSSGQKDGATIVVRMELSWDYWCGMLCAVSFGTERRVFFNSDGVPLRVEGDGRPEVWVS